MGYAQLNKGALSLAALMVGTSALSGEAQTYDLEKAELAKSYFTACSTVAEGASGEAISPAIETCKTSMNDIARLFSAYPDHTPMDVNVLAIYSGSAAYVVLALDMQLHENRLSVDGCNHAYHVENMYNMLTDGTSEDVEAQLRKNATTVQDHLIPWCEDAYGADE